MSTNSTSTLLLNTKALYYQLSQNDSTLHQFQRRILKDRALRGNLLKGREEGWPDEYTEELNESLTLREETPCSIILVLEESLSRP